MPPPDTSAPGRSLLVPLFVDARELWVFFANPGPGAAGLALPAADVGAGESSWAAAVRAGATNLGLAPGTILPLGALESVEDENGHLVSPQVAAVPRPPETFPGVRIPLNALGHPRLVEECPDLEGGLEVVHHVGRYRVRGASCRILEELLARLRS